MIYVIKYVLTSLELYLLFGRKYNICAITHVTAWKVATPEPFSPLKKRPEFEFTVRDSLFLCLIVHMQLKHTRTHAHTHTRTRTRTHARTRARTHYTCFSIINRHSGFSHTNTHMFVCMFALANYSIQKYSIS